METEYFFFHLWYVASEMFKHGKYAGKSTSNGPEFRDGVTEFRQAMADLMKITRRPPQPQLRSSRSFPE